MRTPVLLTILAALLAVALTTLAGQALLQPNRPLIVDATFLLETITPNADGDADITRYRYELSQNATVTISFTSEDGDTFVFRDEEPREQDIEYEGLFSGVVDGYTLADENIAGLVERRLMPEGTYTWELAARTAAGEIDTRSGSLTLAEADAQLPTIPVFSISPQTFSPNQDGIRDRTQMNIVLEKAADLDVYLLGEDGEQRFIAPRIGETREGEAGRYTYDYDGGIDAGSDPPPDGTYTVVASAQDAVGQRVTRTAELTISEGGKPLAEIAAQPSGADVVFTTASYDAAYMTSEDEPGERITPPEDSAALAVSDVTMEVGDVLLFYLVVDNYSDVSIRTHGAPPGTVYQQTQGAANLGQYDQSGAWRVGLECDTTFAYPWRWRVGTDDVLEAVYDPEDDATYYYLPPGERATVWGGVRMTELIETRNPQNCYAGLIHEDVGISVQNARVGARSIELVNPDAPLYDADDSG